MESSALSRLQVVSQDLEDLGEIARSIIDFSEGLKFWVFDGEMGAGKTTLIKVICNKLGVEDTVSSPTYSIINEYQDRNKDTLYHYDFYRLNDELEALDIGVDEYFDMDNYCFVEWPSKVSSLLPSHHYLLISIRLENETKRVIEVTRHV